MGNVIVAQANTVGPKPEHSKEAFNKQFTGKGEHKKYTCSYENLQVCGSLKLQEEWAK